MTVLVPFAKVEPLGGVQAILTPGQLSVAVGANVTTALHRPRAVLVTILPGQAITGFSVSLTVTVKLQLAVLLDVPVAVQLTVLVPFAKVDPLGGVQAILTPGQLSVAVGANVTTALHRSEERRVGIERGQVRTGFSVSLTVTVKMH